MEISFSLPARPIEVAGCATADNRLGVVFGVRADLLVIAAQDVDHGLSWCPGASLEQNPESLNTTAFIAVTRAITRLRLRRSRGWPC
jgi:hypothetical protein